MNRRRTDHPFGATRLWLWPLVLAWGLVGYAGLRHVDLSFGARESPGAYTDASGARCVAPDDLRPGLLGRADTANGAPRS